MQKKKIAEMAVKDIAAAKETRTDFENALPFGNPPINLDTPVAFEDMDEIEQGFALYDISMSRDDEIEEIKKEITKLSEGRLSNYWYYAEKSKTVAAKMARLLKRLVKIGNEVLEAEGKLTGCVMVPDDGYYPYSIIEIAQEMTCARDADEDTIKSLADDLVA